MADWRTILACRHLRTEFDVIALRQTVQYPLPVIRFIIDFARFPLHLVVILSTIQIIFGGILHIRVDLYGGEHDL